jgi:peptidoglycan/xylan/chitin deacetylase (PgdA/CDA1 family)
LAWLSKGKPLPEKPVLLTFDDGYAELAEFALPVLERHGFGAVVFVVTQEVGGSNRWDEGRGVGTQSLLTADQIKEWTTRGIEFGAHSRTHVGLTLLSEAAKYEEVTGSGMELAELLGDKVVSFAYPYGLYDDAALVAAREAFGLAFGCEEGLNTVNTDPFRMKRTMVLPGDSQLAFAWRVRRGFNPLLRLRRRLKIRTRIARALGRKRGQAA